MRRILAVLVVLLVAGCSSGGGTAATSTTARAVPAPLTDFLRGVAKPGSVGFRATYHVLRRIGGVETDVSVVADPPAWEIHVGDVVVRGPSPSTSDETKLSAFGVFSSFFSTGPARQLEVDAHRPTAGAPVFTDRTVAGVPLHCAGVPQAGVVGTTVCLTPQGVVGWVDTAAVHYELTTYVLGP